MNEPYKILLVDDEAEVRTSIIRKIDWSAVDFQVVGDAENGVDALEKIEQLEPDVVLTDIRMPYMDGLEMAERLREIHPSIKVVLFSGFDDFEYAQKAIKLNIIEYILKPVNAEEMMEILLRIKGTLDEEIQRLRDLTNLQESFRKNLPILREKFLSNLVKGNVGKEDIPVLMEEYGLSLLEGNRWVAAKVMAQEMDNAAWNSWNLLAVSVQRLLEDRFQDFGNYSCFQRPSGICVIAAMEDEKELMQLTTFFRELCKEVKKILNCTLIVGIGRVVESIENISHSYAEAREAVAYSRTAGEVVFISDVEPQKDTLLHLDEKDEKELSYVLKFGDEEMIQSCVESISGRMRQTKTMQSGFQAYIIDILSVILRVVQKNGLEENIVFGKYADYNGVLTGIRDSADMQDWLCEVCFAISGKLYRERVGTTQTLIEKAKKYIGENYANSALSLEMVCGYLHISTAYFSTIFKKEVGESYISYLTAIRMEKAAELLKETDERTYQIAAKVGYDEPNYFGYVFKKKFGVSPNKFRGK